MFKLNEKLHNDTIFITDLPLCRVVLMNDQTYPWLILIPRIEGLTELHHIPQSETGQLWSEINKVSRIMENEFAPLSLNVAALGNVVTQLHIHIIARYNDDPTWPGPVWGQHPARPYEDELRIKQLYKHFEELQTTP